ncbi:MAG: hypothetical protein EPN84_05080 [Legionella sp.]|nr:MAG: hypothetical protein EPN84_05080 [Legionella sp.]
MKAVAGCLLSLMSYSVWAIDRGINYDPAHSSAYTNAQIQNNLQGMKNEISKDMQIVHNAGFSFIKTFYSMISTVDGKQTANIADLACPLNLQVMLGVYEFDPGKDNCSNWCDIARKQQVDKAIESVNKYNSGGKKCIVGVAVGNEDIYNWNFTQPNTLMQKHIAEDIAQIKKAIGGKAPVGTAQQDGALIQLAGKDKDPNGIIGKLDFVGVNIYPYWSAEHPNVDAAKEEFAKRYQAIKNISQYQGKELIVTEEGWPSQFSSGQNPNASLANEIAYYKWWQERVDDFDSYYFGLFDKQPTNGDADKFFGLCTPDRKDKVIKNCD